MHSRWYSTAVVLLWLATMSWLVTKKVLPSLLVGEPPSPERIVEAQKRNPVVGWHIKYNGRRVGWAISETASLPNGLTEIHGRVCVRRLPLKDMMKGWLKTFSRFIEPMEGLGLDSRSLMTIDALGHLVGFDSAVRMESIDETFRVRGTVEGRQLQLTIQTGSAVLTTESFLPSNAFVSDALSPQSELPGLRAEQKWTVPVYSPILPAKHPLEIIQARVESQQSIHWNGGTLLCWLVVYRSDPGSGTGGSDKPRGQLWVRPDGAVLRQEISLFDAVVTFDRLTHDEATTLLTTAGDRWWIMETRIPVEHHD